MHYNLCTCTDEAAGHQCILKVAGKMNSRGHCAYARLAEGTRTCAEEDADVQTGRPFAPHQLYILQYLQKVDFIFLNARLTPHKSHDQGLDATKPRAKQLTGTCGLREETQRRTFTSCQCAEQLIRFARPSRRSRDCTPVQVSCQVCVPRSAISAQS